MVRSYWSAWPDYHRVVDSLGLPHRYRHWELRREQQLCLGLCSCSLLLFYVVWLGLGHLSHDLSVWVELGVSLSGPGTWSDPEDTFGSHNSVQHANLAATPLDHVYFAGMDPRIEVELTLAELRSSSHLMLTFPLLLSFLPCLVKSARVSSASRVAPR